MDDSPWVDENDKFETPKKLKQSRQSMHRMSSLNY
jgi:hypothetical protein